MFSLTSRQLIKTTTRLRPQHFVGLNINRDSTRSSRRATTAPPSSAQSKTFLTAQRSLELYSYKIPDIAKAVTAIRGPVLFPSDVIPKNSF
ncbi:hypothetical protein AVEN_32754-1 [Araneus ventricosus]|uniref:Uncharacterized protein n=1 Tax=Araneus ventricosus TaxID=182803 RepID=A0A4Y2CUV0_ARAVE|nr:hypothetical protein AVEN_32754-1 [Araneus ventricosus]